MKACNHKKLESEEVVAPEVRETLPDQRELFPEFVSTAGETSLLGGSELKIITSKCSTPAIEEIEGSKEKGEEGKKGIAKADLVPPGPRLAYKVAEAAVIVGVSESTIRRLINEGDIKVNRRLRHLLIPASELERFIAVRG